MANELTYQSEFTGQQMDAKFTAVAELQTAITELQAAVNAKYSKPSAGIPSTDLDADVNAALAKANSAIQSLADYYTKAEVDALIATINGQEYVDVSSLPTASASTMGKIYLVGPDGSGYYSYYYTSYDGSAYSWVGPLGTTQISLANYATKAELSQLDQKVEGFVALSGWNNGKRIQNNQGVGNTCPMTMTDSATYRCLVVDVKPGIQYVVNGEGAANYRVWCFVDADNKILSVAGYADAPTGNQLKLIPPTGASKLILNTTSDENSYSYIQNKTDDLANTVKALVGIRHSSTIDNASISESINITYLPVGTYKVRVLWSGTNPPPNIAIYGTSGSRTGIVSTYNLVNSDSWINFEKTDAINYIWAYRSAASTCSFSLELFAESTVRDNWILTRKKGNARFQYLLSQTGGLYVSYPSGDKDFVINIAAGGGNGLNDFRLWGYLPKDSAIGPSDITTIHTNASDWFAPYQVSAVNNGDGGDGTYHYTGGSHTFNDLPTARMVNLKYEIDGNPLTEYGRGYANFLRITWSNYVQGYNTIKADGTGREILKEDIELTFDGETWKAHSHFTPLEDIKINRWSAYQMTGIGSGLATTWRIIGAVNREQDAMESGNVGAQGIIAEGATKIVMMLNTTIDLGLRTYCTDSAEGVYRSGNKAYFTVINNNETLSKDDHFDVMGEYKMTILDVDES